MQEAQPNSRLRFAETHVHFSSVSSKQRFLELASKLGFSVLFATNGGEKAEGIEVFSRRDLEGENLSQIKKRLSEERKKADLVAVPCMNREVATWAARNPDVDIIYFPSLEHYKYLDNSLVKLSYEGRTAVELSLSPLFEKEGAKRVQAFSTLRKAVTVLLEKGAVFFITREPKTEYELRSPRSLIAVARLLGIPREAAVRAISFYPSIILEWRGYEGVREEA